MAGVKGKSGGARPGAGRKPSAAPRAATTIYLTPAEREAFDYLRSRAVDTSAVLGRELLRLAALHHEAAGD